MKRILQFIAVALFFGFLFSCTPVENRVSVAMTYTQATLDYTAKVTGNTLTMTNNNLDIIPYWSVSNAAGTEIGHFNSNSSSVIIPFKGTYVVTYTAYTRGGALYTQPKTITIAKTDLSSITTDPKWAMLTNGAAGKTWVLNMANPVGWAGLEYPGASGDNWNWFPDYASNSWVMENKDWGEMHFDLNEAYNDSVKQTALASTSQTNKSGTFVFDIPNNKLIFNGGVEMLYGGDYYADVSNWTSVHVIKLTANELELGVVRDQSRKGEGKCQLVFRYKPKP